MIIDTPLLFWAEEHRPAAFLTVSTINTDIDAQLSTISHSSRILKLEMTAQTWKIVSLDLCYLIYTKALYN